MSTHDYALHVPRPLEADGRARSLIEGEILVTPLVSPARPATGADACRRLDTHRRRNTTFRFTTT